MAYPAPERESPCIVSWPVGTRAGPALSRCVGRVHLRPGNPAHVSRVQSRSPRGEFHRLYVGGELPSSEPPIPRLDRDAIPPACSPTCMLDTDSW